ncbi:Fur family transcriptional regulator [Fervidicella metallireducens AeB]|uniref:Fur family transcriptional regulator n=1 Tax=Fervidicella metallireducens AeB TaxID=1403537 RepID=A0A017RWC9_9CLOT|nr:transcriptional repressor [Fervidicella metallireducens]EYE88240.1 Fur family transcriptional regulator [Fervidicella metallireducens AeB]
MEDNFQIIKKIIEKKGYKFTQQKRVILEELVKSKTHINAKEIYERVKDKNIGLATVYRNIRLFSMLGIVKEIVIKGQSYYEIKIFSRKPLHIHFKCANCNSIIDIDDYNITYEYVKLNKVVEEKYNIQVYDSDIMLIGLCDRCREEERCQDRQNSEG